MGFYPYRTTEDELDAVWDNPEAVNEIFLSLMRSTLARWLDLAAERLAGTGIRLYAMEGNDDPPELYGMLRDSNRADPDRGPARRPRRGHHDGLLRLLQPHAVAHPARTGRRRA